MPSPPLDFFEPPSSPPASPPPPTCFYCGIDIVFYVWMGVSAVFFIVGVLCYMVWTRRSRPVLREVEVTTTDDF